uniref:Arp2/3 complex 41 kDa subunit n=1 Tax=Albugo laibachii Nc14 TaxID=890382 RepID=F0W7K8_9STRA|nr:actinrelated protein 2/3 complex subunit putative [Albugo laibachii Nc14]|eukprot:CCA17109.1 actinrelated protein 2/3 complex subunit putative [Albugo laibachii Nc14]
MSAADSNISHDIDTPTLFSINIHSSSFLETMTTSWHLEEGITCHTWNKDRSKVAVCPNTNEIWIYSNCHNVNVAKWRREAILTEHDMIVTGLDWSPVNDMIVSCSHDRSAYVWQYDSPTCKWKPLMVVLRITRAAIDVKWSPNGKKFAVSSGAKCVAVCYYQPSENWWISKHIKKHKSTVTSLAWHPNSQLLVTGSTDLKCRIFSAHIAEVDMSVDVGPFASIGPFGEILAEFEHANAWINSVVWSPSGDRVAFAGHGSSVHFVHFGKAGDLPTIQVCSDEKRMGTNGMLQSIRFRHLPLNTLLFLSNDVMVGGGADFNVLLFTSDANGFWSLTDLLDKKSSDLVRKSEKGGFSAARSMWESKVVRGQSSEATEHDKGMLWTKHESAITDIRPYSMEKKCVTEFSTSALDGKIVLWKVDDLAMKMAKVKV